MIYVEHKELTKDNYPELYKWYDEKLKEIQNREHIPHGVKNYVFEDKTPIRIQGGMRMDRAAILFPRTASYNGMTWVWCTSTRKTDSGRVIYSPDFIRFKDRETLNPDNLAEAQKILYYMYISPTAKRNIELVNEEKRAAKENARDADEIAVNFLIKTDQSPLSVRVTGSEDNMRYIALGWSVSKAYDMPYEILKKTLYEKVLSSQKNYGSTGRGYKEFIHEAYNLPDLAMRANLNIAIDIGLIEFKDSKCVYKQSGKTICVIPPHNMNTPIKAVENFFEKYIDAKEEFINIITEYKNNEEKYAFARQEVTEEKPDIPIEFSRYTKLDVERLNWVDTKKMASAIGYKKKNTDKMPDLKREICNILKL